jgi:hypothetical protein
MSSTTVATHGVMEGGGSYNRHATIVARGAETALPFLEEAVKHLALEKGDQPVVIADYGSSQGKNSLVPMRVAIKGLRTRVGAERPIQVVHIDQAANDFNTLFDLLHRDPERYSLNDPHVFPGAIGRSFYESVLPPGQVHLGWSSYAAVWLSRIPMRIPGHFISLASTGDVREAFERQGAEDWEFFLSLRASELRPGGRLVVVLPGMNDEGVAGFEPLFGAANDALEEMVADGAIAAVERERMVLGAHARRRNHLMAPFKSGEFRGLTVQRCELCSVADGAWVEYERDGNKEALLDRRAGFFRAIFVPSLATAIVDEGKRQAFADDLQQRLKRRLGEHPKQFHTFAQTIVLAKKG